MYSLILFGASQRGLNNERRVGSQKQKLSNVTKVMDAHHSTSCCGEMAVEEEGDNGTLPPARIGGMEAIVLKGASRVIFRLRMLSTCCHNCWRHDVALHNDVVRGDLRQAEVSLRFALCNKLRRHQADKQSPGVCSLVWDKDQTFPTWALRDKLRAVASELAEEDRTRLLGKGAKRVCSGRLKTTNVVWKDPAQQRPYSPNAAGRTKKSKHLGLLLHFLEDLVSEDRAKIFDLWVGLCGHDAFQWERKVSLF